MQDTVTAAQLDLLRVDSPPVSLREFHALQSLATEMVQADPAKVCLVLAELQPCITMGRAGTLRDLRWAAPQMGTALPRHYVPHGGCTWQHQVGQLGCAPVLSLEHAGIAPQQYVCRLLSRVSQFIRGFDIPCQVNRPTATLTVRHRTVGMVGVAVRGGLTSYGLVLNTQVDLTKRDELQPQEGHNRLTSLHKETRFRLQPMLLRRLLIQALCEEFGWHQPELITPTALLSLH